MALMNPKKEDEEEEETTRMQTDVTDEEMALRYKQTGRRLALGPLIHSIPFRYESLIGSIRKKFAKKRQRAAEGEDLNQNVGARSKRGFLQPQD